MDSIATKNERWQASGAGFKHAIMVRYGECDMQGVVFNPNYLVYVDDVCDQWLSAALGTEWSTVFDCVVKKATLEWHSAARHGEIIDFALSVERWGTTSFDVRVTGKVARRDIVTVDLVYVSVEPGTHTPAPVPDEVRTELVRATNV